MTDIVPKLTLDQHLKVAQEIAWRLTESQGEIDGELEEDLKSLLTNEKDLTDRYAWVIQRLEHEAEFMSLREIQFKERRAQAERALERVKMNFKAAMISLQKKSISGDYSSICIAPVQPRVIIINEKELPSECVRIKTIEEPDKLRIRALLEHGDAVPGAILEPSFSLKVTPTKLLKEKK